MVTVTGGDCSCIKRDGMIHNGKRKQIMRVVEKLATNRRFHEITLAEVAVAAGVGKGTIYNYFKDKDDLFFQAAISGFDELCELLEQKVPDDVSFRVKLSKMCREVIEFFAARGQLVQMMQNLSARIQFCESDIRERWMLKRQKLVDAVSGVLGEGVVEGTIRSDVPMEVLAVFLLGMLRTYAKEVSDPSELGLNSELLVDLFLNGTCRANNKLSTHYMETFRGGSNQ